MNAGLVLLVAGFALPSPMVVGMPVGMEVGLGSGPPSGVVVWMVCASAVGVLLAAAAWCLERALTALGLPTRWVWGGALLLSVGIPLGSLVPGPASDDPAGVGVGLLAAAEQGPEAAEAGSLRLALLRAPRALVTRGTDWVNRIVQGAAKALPTGPGVIQGLLAVWLAATVALGGILLTAVGLLARRRARWPRAELLGRRVRLAPALGPAVVGVFRPEIVLPPWAITLPPEELELVLSHEEEHLRARDPLLLAGGILPAVLLPWSPGLWWLFRRLRDAVEVDCDRRVLRRGVPAKRYGTLLLRLGARAHTRFLPVAAIRPSRPLLHRRLHAMNRKTTRGRIPVVLLAAIAGLGFLALACDADTTVPPEVTGPSVQEAALTEAIPAEPTFTPFEVSPEVLNRPDLQRVLEQEYPPLLRDAGIGGRTIVHIYITQDGDVRNALVAQPSEHTELDQAALRVAREFRFRPALNQGSAVPVWVQIPIAFITR